MAGSSSHPFQGRSSTVRGLGLCDFVGSPADPGNFSHLVEVKNDVAQLFVVVARQLAHFGDADSVFAVADDFQNGLGGVPG